MPSIRVITIEQNTDEQFQQLLCSWMLFTHTPVLLNKQKRAIICYNTVWCSVQSVIFLYFYFLYLNLGFMCYNLFFCASSVVWSPTQHVNYESHLLLHTHLLHQLSAKTEGEVEMPWSWFHRIQWILPELHRISANVKKNRKNDFEIHSFNLTHLCLTRLLDREASIWNKPGWAPEEE